MIRWRPMLHYARSRRTAATIAALVVIDSAGLMLRHSVFRFPGSSGFGVPWVTLLPFLSACAIGLSVRSPMNEIEGTAARSMRRARLAHAGTILVIAALLTAPTAGTLPPPVSLPAALRNLLGLTGLATLCGRFLGGRLSWVLPTAFTLTALTVGASDGIPRNWAWILAPDLDRMSWGLAVACAAVGCMALAQGPTREPADEYE